MESPNSALDHGPRTWLRPNPVDPSGPITHHDAQNTAPIARESGVESRDRNRPGKAVGKFGETGEMNGKIDDR